MEIKISTNFKNTSKSSGNIKYHLTLISQNIKIIIWGGGTSFTKETADVLTSATQLIASIYGGGGGEVKIISTWADHK